MTFAWCPVLGIVGLDLVGLAAPSPAASTKESQWQAAEGQPVHSFAALVTRCVHTRHLLFNPTGEPQCEMNLPLATAARRGDA